MKEVILYTDGACSGNPGPGGWACILKFGQFKKEVNGAVDNTTNNRMELMAVIEGLSYLKEPCSVKVHSDSAYVVNALQKGWLQNWRTNGWKTSTGVAVKNQDLWNELWDKSKIHSLEFVKVAGHADDEDNNRCDELAKDAIIELNRKKREEEEKKAARAAARKRKAAIARGEIDEDDEDEPENDSAAKKQSQGSALLGKRR